MAWGDPIATSAPAFPTSTGPHPLVPQGYFSWAVTGKQYPTGCWWQNLLIPHYDANTYNGRVNCLPYAAQPATNGRGLQLAYHGTQSRDVAANAITLSSVYELGLEVAETVTGRQIVDYSDCGVTTRWNTAGGSMTCHLVEGMGFCSGQFVATTPVIRCAHPVLLINGAAPSGSYTGTKLRIRSAYFNRDWLIYTSASVTWTLGGDGMTLTASTPLTGSVQVAHLTTEPGQEAAYDAASTAVLTGGAVTATVAGNTATMTITWSSAGSGAPLVMTLPHHRDVMGSPTYQPVTLDSLKGQMRGVRASTWTLTEPLPVVSWTHETPIPSAAVPDILAAIAVEKATTYDYAGNGWGTSPYYGGKHVAKLARLAMVAEEVGDTTSRDQLLTRLRSEVSAYLTAAPTGSAGVPGSGYRNVLQYKGGATWRGIATQNGWSDMGADFGSGRFNDHHFHYGYWLYAAAVAGRDDATWRNNIRPYVDALARDICNPSHSDSYFPKNRHKDWWHGHSFASGLVGIDVGPGQESVSEAVGAWHGVQMWGHVTSNTDLRDLGRLMAATEARAAKKYWHIYDTTSVYPAPFANGAVAVIVRTHKIARETYFGNRPEYFYGIITLPILPSSHLHLDEPWVERGYAAASANVPITPTTNPQDTGWNSVIYCLLAVMDPDTGYESIKSLPLTQIPAYQDHIQYGPDFDNGLSKAAALAWASTRPGFTGTGDPVDPPTPTDPPDPVLTPGPAGSSATALSVRVATGAHPGGYTPVTGDHTVTEADRIVGVQTVPAVVTLPAMAGWRPGTPLTVADETGACSIATPITLTGASIDGQTTLTLTSANSGARLYWNGAAWSVISAG